MEKVCRKPAVKSSTICIFDLVNSPRNPMYVWDFWKQVVFKRDHEKGNLIFSFASSHFVWTKFWKEKTPRTSYQSLWVTRHAYKNSFFSLTLWIWKLWTEKGKNDNRLNKEWEKTFFKICEMLFFSKICKIEDTSFKLEYSGSY